MDRSLGQILDTFGLWTNLANFEKFELGTEIRGWANQKMEIRGSKFGQFHPFYSELNDL